MITAALENAPEYDFPEGPPGDVILEAVRAERERCAQELYDVARWCRDHGFETRARHTESAARRLQGVLEDTDGNGHGKGD